MRLSLALCFGRDPVIDGSGDARTLQQTKVNQLNPDQKLSEPPRVFRPQNAHQGCRTHPYLSWVGLIVPAVAMRLLKTCFKVDCFFCFFCRGGGVSLTTALLGGNTAPCRPSLQSTLLTSAPIKSCGIC